VLFIPSFIKPPSLVQELLLLGLQTQRYYTRKVYFFIKNGQKVVIMISQSIGQIWCFFQIHICGNLNDYCLKAIAITLTIQRTPHPQKGHRQMSTADLPTNAQNNFIIMFNTQHVKYYMW